MKIQMLWNLIIKKLRVIDNTSVTVQSEAIVVVDVELIQAQVQMSQLLTMPLFQKGGRSTSKLCYLIIIATYTL